MATKRKTSAQVAKKAARALKAPASTSKVRSVAGSASSQTAPRKKTSAKVAKRASVIVRDGKASKSARSVAGSTLAQRGPRKAKKRVGGKAAKRVAASALTQSVTTRRLASGKVVRVVLVPYGGSLPRGKLESVVSSVLVQHQKKK